MLTQRRTPLGRRHDRNRVNGDKETSRQVDVGGRGSGWRRVWHVTGIDGVDGGEIVEVVVKDRGLDQAGKGGTCGGQNRIEVAKGLFRLRLDAFSDSTGGWVDADRPGAEDESVGDDRLALRAESGRSRVCGHCLSHHWRPPIASALQVSLLRARSPRPAALATAARWPNTLGAVPFLRSCARKALRQRAGPLAIGDAGLAAIIIAARASRPSSGCCRRAGQRIVNDLGTGSCHEGTSATRANGALMSLIIGGGDLPGALWDGAEAGLARSETAIWLSGAPYWPAGAGRQLWPR